jgi:hypothetical protein
MENILLAALGRGQEIAAVCAEDQGADRSHGVVCCCLVDFRLENFVVGVPSSKIDRISSAQPA